MQKVKTIAKMLEVGALAIVRTDDYMNAKEIALGCIDGSIPVMEISYTLNSAGDIIRKLRKEFGDDLLVGAGTVLDSETARHAILNDAQFIISPNFSIEVAKICNRYQIPYAPGCSTLTEAVDALTYGATFIKAFPISDFYGYKLTTVFKTPIPQMTILASGGINLENLNDWLKSGVDLCGFGNLLTKGDRFKISENAKAIRDIIDKFREN